MPKSVPKNNAPFRKIDYTLLRNELLSINPSSLFHDDVNTEVANLIVTLKTAISNSSVTISSRSYKAPICPWMTNDILATLMKKQFWYNKWKQHKENEYYLRQFKRLRNDSVAIIRARKRDYYSGLIKRVNGDTKKI